MKKKLFVLATLLCCMFAGILLAACGGDSGCSHPNATAEETVAATCEKGGEKVYTCPDCKKSWKEDTDPLGHDFVENVESSVTATCTSAGKKVEICSRCSALNVVTLPQLKHEYVTDEATSRQASCTSIGVSVSVCKLCGDHKEEYEPAAGHKWEGTDCTGKKCSVCEEMLPAIAAHDYKETSHTAATCTTDGEIVLECTLCHDSYKVTELAKGHNWQVESESGEYTLKSGTENCTYLSSHTLKCTECQATKTEEYEIAERHNYVTKITKQATCSEQGTKATVCTVCGKTKENSSEVFSDDDAHQWNEGVKAGAVTTYTCKLNKSHTKTSIEADKDAKDVQVTKESLTGADEVVVKGASIAMDDTAKKSLPDDKPLTLGVDIADTASEIDPSLQNQLSNNVYNITLSNGNDNITQFGGGKVKVRIPYSLQEGEDVNAIVIWYVEGTELVKIEATYSDGYVTFETEHFSYYTVGKYTPEEMCEKFGHYEVTRTKEATCIESGYTITVCTRCGKNIDTQYTVATGHAWETDEQQSKPASCVEAGLEVKKCSKCEVEIRTVLQATGHSWEADEKKEATCQASGKESYSCSKCGNSYTITLPQRAHEFTTSKKEATCTEEGYTTYTCKYCQYSYQGNKVSAFGHRWDLDAPTCGQGQVCTVCGAAGLPATGEHVYENGVCTVCGEGCEHDLQKKEDVASTCLEAGYTLYECSKCGFRKKDDFKPLGDHKFTAEGVCSVCGTRDEAATGFYDVFMKSLNAKKFTLTAEEGSHYTYISDSREEEFSVRNLTAYLNITEDGKSLYSVELTAERRSQRGKETPEEKDVYEIYILFDGECQYMRMCENNGEYQYSKEYTTDLPEPYATIFAILQDEAVIDYLTTLKSTNDRGLYELVNKVMDGLFTRTQTAEGYSVTLRADTMRTLNDDLMTLSVQKFVDKYFGTASFYRLSALVKKLVVTLKASAAVEEIFTMAADYHIERDSLIGLIESMAMKFTGNPLGIEEMLGDEMFTTHTLAEIIEMQNHMEAGEVSKYIDDTISMLSEDEVTVYSLLAQSMRADAEVIHSVIGNVFKDGITQITFQTDAAGNIQSLALTLRNYEYEIPGGEGERIQANGGVNIKWNEANDVVYDREFDILGSLQEEARKLCAANGGSYTYSATDSDGWDIVYGYSFRLQDGVLSLDTIQRHINIYDSSTAPGKGRVERGYESVYSEHIPDLSTAGISYVSDCVDWVCYSATDRTNGTHLYRSFEFTRTYGEDGQMLDETIEGEYSSESSTSSATVYLNTKTKEFSYKSQHKAIVDASRTTTEDDVSCGERYYIYYICEVCEKDMTILSGTKSHQYDVSVKLAPGSVSCEDGVIIRHECKLCGEGREETIYEHYRVTTVETFEMPHGDLKMEVESCACGAVGTYVYFNEGDGCQFDYSSENYLGDGHSLYTYRCAYEGCTAYYTVEEWNKYEGCLRSETRIYKFYYQEGQQLGKKEGYSFSDTWYTHTWGEPNSEHKEFTIEQDGYTGYRDTTTYSGCEHTGPFTMITETHYDKFGREIYDFRSSTRQGDTYTRWTKLEFASETSCDCTVTDYYQYGDEEATTETYQDTHHTVDNHYVSASCTMPEMQYSVCRICDYSDCYMMYPPHGHEFNNGSCIYCGLEAQQESSGTIVLEDRTDYYGYDNPYTVGVWNRAAVSNITLQLYLVYLGDDGAEEMVEYSGTYQREDLPGKQYIDCYIITVDRTAVRAAVDPGKHFVGLRLTFLPVGSDDPQVTSITLVDETNVYSAFAPVYEQYSDEIVWKRDLI